MSRMYESAEQQALFRWAALSERAHPELELMYHIPNEGVRTAANGARLKAEGMRAGVPDICLPVARGSYNSLYIELKARKNKPTEAQEKWIAALNAAGNLAVVCWGWEAAKKTIETYLGRTEE